jgi:hypothetical protein
LCRIASTISRDLAVDCSLEADSPSREDGQRRFAHQTQIAIGKPLLSTGGTTGTL